MPGQSETNLFKLVCKRAASMRERYRSSHWTANQIKKTNTKKTRVNKTKPKSESIDTVKKGVRQSSSSFEKNGSLSKKINHSNDTNNAAIDGHV